MYPGHWSKQTPDEPGGHHGGFGGDGHVPRTRRPVHRCLTGDEAAYIVDNCEAPVLVSSAELREPATALLDDTPNVEIRLMASGTADGYEFRAASISSTSCRACPRASCTSASSTTSSGAASAPRSSECRRITGCLGAPRGSTTRRCRCLPRDGCAHTRSGVRDLGRGCDTDLGLDQRSGLRHAA